MAGKEWLAPESAPRTGEMILADLGYPWPCIACWNETEEEWVYVNLQMNMVDGGDDPYFENEYAKASELKFWMPLPKMSR